MKPGHILSHLMGYLAKRDHMNLALTNDCLCIEREQICMHDILQAAVRVAHP